MMTTNKYRELLYKLRSKQNKSFILSNVLLLFLIIILTIILIFQYDRHVYTTRIYGTGIDIAWAKIYFQSNNTFVYIGGSCMEHQHAKGIYEIKNDTIRLFSDNNQMIYSTRDKPKAIGDFKYIVKGDSITYIFVKSDTIQFKKGIIPLFVHLKLLWE